MIYRYAHLRRFRLKPRPGVVRDRDYLAWLHTQPCIVASGCSRWIEAHHVGHPRDDHRAVPLCSRHHRESRDAVHQLGRRAFERQFGISFEAAIIGLNDEYEATRTLTGIRPADRLREQYL